MKNCQVEEVWLSTSFFQPVVIGPKSSVQLRLSFICHPGLFFSLLCPMLYLVGVLAFPRFADTHWTTLGLLHSPKTLPVQG